MRQALVAIRRAALLALCALALLATGCARLPPRGDPPPSQAIPAGTDAPLDRAIEPALQRNPGMSGFRLVSDGVEAFVLRALSAREARRSLDVQTYIWHDDLTGRLVARELLRAADRGVRVRLLLDDVDARAKHYALAALDAHPSIEVRLFNPFASRRGALAQAVEGATSFARINHRMHNKSWIADGRLAVTGGRNIGDEYFAASEATNFVDLDYAVVGPALQPLAQSFDRYWNSPAVWPVAALSPALVNDAALAQLRSGGDALQREARASPWLQAVLAGDTLRRIESGELPMHWTARWQVWVDDPLKALRDEDPLARSEVLRGFTALLRDARTQATLVSPYFVPGPQGAQALVEMVAAGREVRVLTNSLAANDVAAVHGGYAKYRGRLVDGGVQLWELKPDRGSAADASLFGSSGAALHTKAAVVDDAAVFVGSFNLDPRSVSLNCEQGVLAEHPALARELQAIFARMVEGERAWRLGRDARGRLQWSDGMRVETRDPDASLSRRAVARLLRWLPLDSQL